MRIDAEQRRQEIARITIDLIAREGLAAATIRRIAGEGDWSTASITNYFIDKHELLVWTFEVLSGEGEDRFGEALVTSGKDPLPPLMTMIPWCAANVRRWKAYLAFWDAAVRDPELAGLIARSTRVGTALLGRLVRQVRPGAPDSERLAELLNTNVQGMALQILVDPTHWTEPRIRQSLTDVAHNILGRATP